jgi:hypothetical protein
VDHGLGVEVWVKLTHVPPQVVEGVLKWSRVSLSGRGCGPWWRQRVEVRPRDVDAARKH